MENFLSTRSGLEYLLSNSPSDMSVSDAISKYYNDLKNSQKPMELTEGDVILRTRSGVTLEVRNGGLYTTNRQEIEQALDEDLHSDNPMDVQMAESVCLLLQEHGLVAEVN